MVDLICMEEVNIHIHKYIINGTGQLIIITMNLFVNT